MTTKRLMVILMSILAVFMVATVIVAVWQEQLGWGWWWTVPVGGGFVIAIIGFRLLVQRAQESERREDAEEDAQEA